MPKPRKAKPKATAWPEVLRVLPDDQTRSWALGRFRDLGFSADSFASSIEVRQTVLEGLVRTEDLLEAVKGPKAQTTRTHIREIRRRLETELWP